MIILFGASPEAAIHESISAPKMNVRMFLTILNK